MQYVFFAGAMGILIASFVRPSVVLKPDLEGKAQEKTLLTVRVMSIVVILVTGSRIAPVLLHSAQTQKAPISQEQQALDLSSTGTGTPSDADTERLDAILDKVATGGAESLSEEERKDLESMREKLRQKKR